MLLVLDINETLLDMSPLDPLFGGAENRAAWFSRLIRLALIRTAARSYRPFGALALDAAADLGFRVDREELSATMAALPAHPDVLRALPELHARHEVVALGNSALDVVRAQLESAGIARHVADIHSAAELDDLKPSPRVYRDVLERHGRAPEDAVMVAAHDWDIAGAAAVGMRTAHVDRGLAPQVPGLTATWTVAGLDELPPLLPE